MPHFTDLLDLYGGGGGDSFHSLSKCAWSLTICQALYLIIESNIVDKNVYPPEIYSLEEETKLYGWGKTIKKTNI